MDVVFGVITAVLSAVAIVVSVIAMRHANDESRIARVWAAKDAARDRILAGPLPHISLLMERHPEGRRLRIVVQNRGRAAITMSGGGLAFELPNGAQRLITIAYNEEVRVDPEGAPRGYLMTAPVLQNILADAVQDANIRPFVICGTDTIMGEDPMPRELIELLLDEAPAATEQTFTVIDLFDDKVRNRQLTPDGHGGHTLTDGRFMAFIQVGDGQLPVDDQPGS